MKKFLIFTVTAGNGHNSAANAVKEQLEKEGAEVKVVDLLHEFCKNKAFIWVQETGYGIAVKHLRHIYNGFFKFYQKLNPEKYYKSPVQSGLLGFYDKVLKLINNYQPDAILCSHFLPAVMISNLRKIYSVPAKTFAMVTDHIVCPFWESATGIDYLLIPDEKLVDILLRKGYRKEQLLPYGITVKHKFSKPIPKDLARKQLDLKQNVFTILVMYGGGFWSGNYNIVKNIVRHIKGRELQIIIPNARDVRGKEKIDSLKVDKSFKILNLGFANNVEMLMSASDVLIGKAGGLSTTEAVNIGLPIICCSNLPEQEIANAKMLVEEGAAMQYKNDGHLIEILNDILNNPDKLIKMRENILRIRRPFATKKVAEDMLNCSTIYEESDIDYSKVNANIKRMLKRTKPASKTKKRKGQKQSLVKDDV